MCEFAGVMGAMIGLATVVIIAIVAWLINYMVKFMFGRVLFSIFYQLFSKEYRIHMGFRPLQR